MQPEEATPPRVGPYVVEGVLGRGGMGVVYRARHTSTGALVALKTVRLAEPGRLSQIRREALALGRLNHPGVVRVLGQGVDAGVPWYAMQLLEGQTLADLLSEAFRHSAGEYSETPTAVTLETSETSSASAKTERGNLSPAGALPTRVDRASAPPASLPRAAGGRLPELLGIAHQLCEALAYVHGEGVVHRDIKPSNVFVTPTGQTVLVDFGLASRVGDAGGREVLASDTFTGGSARYMSPEQIRGEPLDPRCDLYALGCVLFEIIIGRTPFTGNLGQVIDQHQRRPPPKLSSSASEVPQVLERLVGRLLAKDRRDRLGYAEDVAATLVQAGAQPKPWATQAPRARTYLYRPPLVGRQEVLKEFERLNRRLLEGHGSMVFVRGESGVGKTRCALELAQQAARLNIQVIASGCSSVSLESNEEGQSAPLGPLRPLLRTIADLCIEGGEHESARLLGSSAPLLAAFEPSFAHFVTNAHATPSLPAAAARALLYRSLAEVLFAFASSTPVLLIIDDLQWADELTLGFLTHLATQHLRDLPLIVLGLLRSDEQSAELNQLIQGPLVRCFDLQRLRGDDVGRMVAGMLSLEQPPPEFVQYLSGKSEGNPFFVAEYLRIAVAEQVLVRNDHGQWSLAESTEPTRVLCESLPLPQSLREVVERRTAGVSPNTRSVLVLAATVGRHFDLALLQQAAQLSDAEVLEAVTDLVQRHVLESAANGAGFRFVHDKLREIPYAELDQEQRKHTHRRVALALAASVAGASDSDAQHAALGHHWLEAGEPKRAVPHLHAAGDAAQRVNALDQASSFYRSALNALGDTNQALSSEFASVSEKLADVLALRGVLDAARSTYEQSLAVRREDEALARARLLRKLGKTWEISHDHQRALAAYAGAETALASLDRESPEALQEHAQVQLKRVWVYYWLAQVDRMTELLAGIDRYIHDGAPALVRSDYYGALVERDFRAHRYRISKAIIDNARSCLRAAEEAKAPVETAFARFRLGFALLFAGELDAAESELHGALRSTRRLGDTTSELRCLAYLTLTRRRAQSVQETRQLAMETLERASAANMLDYVGLAHSCLAWVAWKQGNLAEAQRLSQSALDGWAKLSFPYPFQWSGALTLLAVQVDRAPLRQLVQVAAKLLEPALAKLPDTIDSALEATVRTYEAGEREQAHDGLKRVIASASALGYL